MKRLAAAALLAAAGLPLAAAAADPAPVAVELSRLALPEQNWKRMMRSGSEQVRQYIEATVRQSGATVPPDFSERVVAEFERIMPSYQEVLDLQAGLLVKHYTEPEMRELLAFYRTPLGQKAIRVMPEISADVNAQMLTLMQQRLPTMFDRLTGSHGPAQPGAAGAVNGAAAPASKPPAKKPAAR
jgi:hypothetical protein